MKDVLGQIKSILEESTEEGTMARVKAVLAEADSSDAAEETTEPEDHEDVLPDELEDTDDLEKLFAESAFDIIVGETSLKPIQESFENAPSLADILTEAASATETGDATAKEGVFSKLKDKLRALAAKFDPLDGLREIEAVNNAIKDEKLVTRSGWAFVPVIGQVVIIIKLAKKYKGMDEATYKKYISQAETMSKQLQKIRQQMAKDGQKTKKIENQIRVLDDLASAYRQTGYAKKKDI